MTPNAVVPLDERPSFGHPDRHYLIREEPIVPCGRRSCVGPNGKRVLVLARDAERRVFGDIFCGEPHDEIAHGVRKPHQQTDPRGIALEVDELGNEGEQAGGTFLKGFGFAVLLEEIGHPPVVHDGDSAHSLHADDEHRVGVTAPDSQAGIVERRHTGSAVLAGDCIGRDGCRKAPGDGRDSRGVDRVHGSRDIAP
jgi:hypothetical protein